MKNIEKIKVLGVGGSGCNAITRMFQKRRELFQYIELIAINCDLQDLKHAKADIKIQIGKRTTQGFGAGADPEIGYRAALEQREEIKKALEGAKIVFITSGMGGGTGTKGSSVVAHIAKNDIGALTIGIVTIPFSFEGPFRKKIAYKGIELLRQEVDSLIVIENDKILSKIDEHTTVEEAFWKCDEVLQDIVFGMARLLFSTGFINIDFADIKEIMRDSGQALFGIGKGKGENMLEEAAKDAVNFPFSNISIDGAKGLIFNFFIAKDAPLMDLEKAARIITRRVSPSAKIIFGVTREKQMKNNEAKVIVIATGID